jgi:hypothetical protein
MFLLNKAELLSTFAHEAGAGEAHAARASLVPLLLVCGSPLRQEGGL